MDCEAFVIGKPEAYEHIYAHFVEHLGAGWSLVENALLRWITNAFLIGELHVSVPFE
jgi:hypothetical protein